MYDRGNASTSMGFLELKATKEGNSFRSAKICTKGKRDFCPDASNPNGIRVQANIKLPKGDMLANVACCAEIQGEEGGQGVQALYWQ